MPDGTYHIDRLQAIELQAEFADDQTGFGLYGGFWGARTGVPNPSGESVIDRAEIWYAMR